MVKIKRYATMKSVLSENVRCLMQEDVFLSFDSEVRLEDAFPAFTVTSVNTEDFVFIELA